ncbi:MAG: prolipoprotein diacylglyceryl transferase [Puniceicoccales bacterium]|jgi:phosphatidylglycerol:prolipoprotein diacylglycerol transferase|nr:prolipoprotein diacylglyceryl transferase [Puniceicoccales bacterium]
MILGKLILGKCHCFTYPCSEIDHLGLKFTVPMLMIPIHRLMLAYLTVRLDPFLLRFPNHWFIEGIRWYGVGYVVSYFLVQFFLASYSKGKLSPLTAVQNDALLIYFALGVVFGGRLGYCLLYDFGHFVENPLSFFQIWNGGMASHGGFVGGILAIFYFSKKFRCNIFRVGDIMSSIIPLCLMIGRLCNFINGELVGRVTDVPWGMIFENSATLGLVPRHPSPLYEAFFEGFLLFIILQILIRRKGFPDGYLSGIFLILYSTVRMGCEFFREPDAELIWAMTRGQFFSIFLLIFGIILIFFRRRIRQKTL